MQLTEKKPDSQFKYTNIINTRHSFHHICLCRLRALTRNACALLDKFSGTHTINKLSSTWYSCKRHCQYSVRKSRKPLKTGVAKISVSANKRTKEIWQNMQTSNVFVRQQHMYRSVAKCLASARMPTCDFGLNFSYLWGSHHFQAQCTPTKLLLESRPPICNLNKYGLLEKKFWLSC